MASNRPVKEFLGIQEKLAAPKKLSAFEKERQAAAAKQQRAEEENAVALRAFEDSFADQGDGDDSYASYGGNRGPPAGPRGAHGYGGQRGSYGMPSMGPRSGPGSLGPGPGVPPPSMKRKRALDEMREQQEARCEVEELGSRAPPYSRADMVEEEEVDAPRPTIQLSSLPPGTTLDSVRVLLMPFVSVHSVRFDQPHSAVESRKSVTAIATLDAEVTTAKIDVATTSLRNKYMGYGFYLKISRHLSSATMHPMMPESSDDALLLPFGAQQPRDERPRFGMRHEPPPQQRSFAPPNSYDSIPICDTQGQGNAIISVAPPLSIEAIKAVHTVADRLLNEPNPERALQLEAMLMQSPAVRHDERFAFLFDSRSPAGVYYRYILWGPEEVSDAVRAARRNAKGPERIFDDVPIDWSSPNPRLPYPDLKSLADAVADIEYDSSGEESEDDDGEVLGLEGRAGAGELNERRHNTPLKRARLVYMLSRLPTSNARLRRGDLARVTNFAINNAGQGAEEIVDVLLLNVRQPFAYSLAADFEEQDPDMDEDDAYEPNEDLVNMDSSAPAVQPRENKRDDDPSNAKLIALYVISDILSASSNAGARNAWRYRSLFETAFKVQQTFIYLGKLDKELGWGRLKAEQWKRRISVLFDIWEGSSVFSPNVLVELRKNFFEPPLTEAERIEMERKEREEEASRQEEVMKNKFKKLDGSPVTSASPVPPPQQAHSNETRAKIPTDDIDGDPMSDDDDIDGKPMSDDDDIDGQPMSDDEPMPHAPEPQPEPAKQEEPPLTVTDTDQKAGKKSPPTSASQPSPGPKKRMRAEDMFADSDEEK